MFLAVDIGNSQTSFGIYEGVLLKHHWRTETKVSRTSDEFAALLFPLFDHVGLRAEPWEAVVVCSVVPPIEYSFHNFCQDYLKAPILNIDSKAPLGFGFNVDTPQEVGADRLANAAYAVKHLRLPAIVVDFGTATTFDLITPGKTYEGGVILPGVKLGLEALGSRTAKLPVVGVEFPKSVIGKNTVDCIRAGVLYGYCDMIDGLLDRTQRECGEPCEVALTGGLSPLFQGRLRTRALLLPNLTLDGIALLYAHSLNTLSARNT